MLAKLLEDEIKKQGISKRSAAKKIGIAHTTISRILDGKQVDLDTVQLICRWININVSDVLNTTDVNADLTSLLSSILQRNPRLQKEFTEAAAKLNNGEIEIKDLEDILAYITFRIKISQKLSNSTQSDGNN